MSKKNIFLISFLIVIIVVISIIFTMSNKENSTMQNISKTNTEETNSNQSTSNVNGINNTSERKDDIKLYIKVNSKILTSTLETNLSVDVLIEKLEKQDIVIDMKDYANFEKVGSLGFSLPRNDEQITTEAGDIILYQGSQLVIYYDTNNWNFTKLGHIDDINQEELKNILGKGNVTVTLSLERN